jgi:hypothetical protein
MFIYYLLTHTLHTLLTHSLTTHSLPPPKLFTYHKNPYIIAQSLSMLIQYSSSASFMLHLTLLHYITLLLFTYYSTYVYIHILLSPLIKTIALQLYFIYIITLFHYLSSVSCFNHCNCNCNFSLYRFYLISLHDPS